MFSKLKIIKDLVLCLNLKNKKIKYSLVIDFSFSERYKSLFSYFSLYSWSKIKSKKEVSCKRTVCFEKLNINDCLIALSNLLQDV